MRLEFDEFEDTYIIRLTEAQVADLEWDEGDDLKIKIYEYENGNELRVTQK